MNTVETNLLASKFCEKMESFGVKVLGVERDKEGLCFYYSVRGRYHFSYDELEQLQAIVDPSIQNHDSIRIVGFDGTYTARVKINQ